jgi:hypothetical protein
LNLLDALIEDELELPPTLSGIPLAPRREIWICIRVDGPPDGQSDNPTIIGAGSRNDPYDGSTHQRFDKIMLKANSFVTPNCTIRFGPGTFQTKGGGGGAWPNTGFLPQTGQKLIGSGMYVTTLQLIVIPPLIPPVNNFIPVVGINSIELAAPGLEISDLCLDANLHRLPAFSNNPAYPKYMVSGLFLSGSGAGSTGVTARRVRIINWGTHTPSYVYPDSGLGLECFPIFVNGPSCVVEDCIAEQPFLSNARESTVICANGGVPGSGTVLRNSLVDGVFRNPGPYPKLQVTALSYVGDVVTLQTQWPHCMQVGDYILISGSDVTVFNHRFKLDFDPIDYRTLKFTVVGATGSPNIQNMLVGIYSGQPLRVVSLSAVGPTVTLQTADDHGRTAAVGTIPAEWIRVSGASPVEYNGSFQVLAIIDSKTLTYLTSPNPPSSPATGEIYLDKWSSLPVLCANPPTVALDGADYIMTLTFAAPHFKIPGDYVLVWGVTIAVPPPPPTIDPEVNRYNGYFPVTASISRTQLKVKINGDPYSAATSNGQINKPIQGCSTENSGDDTHVPNGPGSTAERNRLLRCTVGGPYHDTNKNYDLMVRENYYYDCFRGIYRNCSTDSAERRLIFQDNILEISLHIPGSVDAPAGISLYGREQADVFHDVFARGNIIRHIDGLSDIPSLAQNSLGISIDGAINVELLDISVITLCNGAAASSLTCAIGNDYIAGTEPVGLEISDLTIDANQANASITDAAVGGIAVSGKNILIQ